MIYKVGDFVIYQQNHLKEIWEKYYNNISLYNKKGKILETKNYIKCLVEFTINQNQTYCKWVYKEYLKKIN